MRGGEGEGKGRGGVIPPEVVCFVNVMGMARPRMKETIFVIGIYLYLYI